ncbi:MAG TPA: hypothetical protein VMR98_02505, partial [Candidatus Polarisedimenticolaceae bacterium]|nr:hypothetical protein [Candidatus Polarisedimenticolaceae bacterium]
DSGAILKSGAANLPATIVTPDTNPTGSTNLLKDGDPVGRSGSADQNHTRPGRLAAGRPDSRETVA